MPDTCGFSHIFKPKKLRGFDIRNSVKYAACSISNFNTRDGFVTDREYARMEVIARTGAGIITNQGAYPDPRGEGKVYFRQLSIAEDKFIPGLRKTADLIHQNGAVAIQQILHGGRYGGIDLGYSVQPSAVPQTLRHFRPPRAMSKSDIQSCIMDHAMAAVRAMEAGFDGVEITSFMGYLLSNFNSKFTNRRTDEYGGSVANRARFMVEMLRAIRDGIGDKPLILVRLNGVELMDEYGGNTPEECVEFMKLAEHAGVDMISVVAGWHESRTGALGRDLPHDYWLPLADAAKKAVEVPIAFGPRLADPELAEASLAEGRFDFWEVCRPFLADPALLHKLAENRAEDVKPCLGGLLCLARMFRNLPYQCTVNPRLGHEAETAYGVAPPSRTKRVMVIGGGPAGMECALTAAQRGHEVALYERRDTLGGQLHAASREVGEGRAFLDLVHYYEKQLRDMGIDVTLSTDVTPALCAKVGPDVVVVATGSTIGGELVAACQSAKVVSADDALRDPSEVGDKLVVLGGERAALVAAEYFASIGRGVVVLEEGERIASDVIDTFRWRHYAWLAQFGVEVVTSVTVKEITDEGVVAESPAAGCSTYPADTVIVGGPRKAAQDLVTALEFVCDELYVVGDAVKPRSLHNAIRDGYLVGAKM